MTSATVLSSGGHRHRRVCDVTSRGLISRREALAAGGAAVIAANGLPAWARTFASGATAIRKPDSLPFPHLPAGTSSMPKIEHIVVLIMENHSFDNLLGAVPFRVKGRELVDGFTRKHGKLVNFNRDAHGRKFYAQTAVSPCQLDGEPSQAWNASHISYDNGRNDGFVRASGPIAMRYWDDADLPFTYSLAQHFPLGQRYFCSVLAQTYPNRRFFFTGTASGTIATDNATFTIPAANGTIWDRLDAHKISWGVYYENLPSFLIVPGSATPARANRQHHFTQFLTDAAAGALPQFSFIDPDYTWTSEENPQDIQVGEQFIAEVVHALTSSPKWGSTALFITYDEHGGYYDHVPPPRAIKPDNIAPILGARRRARRVRPLRVPRPDDRRLAVGSRRLRLERGPGPHLDARVHRAQVEPAGDDLPRRERGADDRLFRLQARGVHEAAGAKAGARARGGAAAVPRGRAQPAAAHRAEHGQRHQPLAGERLPALAPAEADWRRRRRERR